MLVVKKLHSRCLFLSVRAEAELLLFFVCWLVVRVQKKVEREPETDPQGTVGLGYSYGVPLRGTPI